MKQLILVTIVLSLIACSGAGSSNSGSSSSARTYLSLKYKNGDASSQSLSVQSADDNIALLFGTIGVQGFQYGQKAVKLGQTSSEWWSSWNIVPTGLASSSDFYLPTGGEVDLRALAKDRGEDGALIDITTNPAYVREVGTFSFDLLEVWGVPSPVNTNNAVCGSQYLAYAMSSAFPDLFFNVCQHFIIRSSFDNSFVNGLHVLFARKDWFPSFVQIYREADHMTGATFPCFHSSTPLNGLQEEIVTSYLKMKYGSSASGIVYDQVGCIPNPMTSPVPVSIVPQSGDVPIVQFTEYKVNVPETATEDGLTIPAYTQSIFGADLEAVISFNLKPSMIQNYALFNDSTDTSDIVIDPAADGTPWGLSVEFRAVKPPLVE